MGLLVSLVSNAADALGAVVMAFVSLFSTVFMSVFDFVALIGGSILSGLMALLNIAFTIIKAPFKLLGA